MLSLIQAHKKVTILVDEFGDLKSCAYSADDIIEISMWLDDNDLTYYLQSQPVSVIIEGLLVDVLPSENDYLLSITRHIEVSDLVQRVEKVQGKQHTQALIINYLFASIIGLTVLGTVSGMVSNKDNSKVFTVVNGLSPLLAAICGYYFSESKKDG